MIELALGAALIWEKHGDDITAWLEKQAKEKGLEFVKEHWQKFQWRQAGRGGIAPLSDTVDIPKLQMARGAHPRLL